MSTANPFAEASGQYARARPQYPSALFAWIAAQCGRRERAWDCATGNGQAATGLAEHFVEVRATDLAHEQIAHGIVRPNVKYSVAPAEACPLADGSVDLVTVAEALHWFDFARFWPEVRRIAADGAFFCAWGYEWFECPDDLEASLVSPFRKLVSPFWPAPIQLLLRGYRPDDVSFPFEPTPAPSFAIEMAWTLGQVLDYMCTFSAYKRGRADPAVASEMDALLARVRAEFEIERVFALRMPLKILAGRISREG